MVHKYELITHFPMQYADLRAVRKFVMIRVCCPVLPLSDFTIRREWDWELAQ